MNSLGVLKAISKQHDIVGSVPRAMEAVSGILDEGLDLAEERLLGSSGEAPPPLEQIVEYILDAGGKRIRPSLCLLSSKIGGEAEHPVDLAVVCELLHNATLLHDDVIDEGDVRRGKPAARMVWSNALSILGGDFILMKCVDMMSQLDGAYMGHFVTTLKALVNGEVVQLRLREKIDTSSEDYFKIVRGKTSSLFSFATRTGSQWGGASEGDCVAMGEFGNNIGIAFQLIDDVLDFSVDAEDLGKDLLADISQGKMTLPVIEAAKKDASVSTLLGQMIEGGEPGPLAAKIQSIVRESGSLDGVKDQARQFTEASVASLGKVSGGDREVVSVLQDLSFALLHRGK